MLPNIDADVIEITLRSLQVTLSALFISSLFGVPFGVWFAFSQFSGKRILNTLIYTGMGLPPVVVGLILFLLFSRSGILGNLNWLFSIPIMITAQIILATPLIIGMTMSSILAVDPDLRLQLRSLGATHWQANYALLFEARFGVLVGIVAGFGAIISEVGAVMLVGGNIEGRTRILTTAIVLETRRGNFDLALALGMILLTLSFLVNFVVVLIQTRR